MCRFWPIRSYDWGNCEALSSRHSDLSALKKLLFEVMFEELKEHTEQRYHKFRQNTLFNLDDPNRCLLPLLCANRSAFPQWISFSIVFEADVSEVESSKPF